VVAATDARLHLRLGGAYDTIYAHQDREDDALVGVRSTARLFADSSHIFLAACYTGTVVLLAVAGALAGLQFGFYAALALAAALLAAQIVRLDIDNPALCLRLFKMNREVGLLVAAAIALGRV